MKALMVPLALLVLLALPVLADDHAGQGADNIGPLQPLKPQSLAPGACGIFLWSRNRQPEFVFFTDSSSGISLVQMQGRELRFMRSPAGEVVTARGITQNYVSNADRLSLRIDLSRGEKIDQGERISQGVITITDERGWEQKTPVSGVASCQPR
jgi:hypothetical protein